MLEGNANGSAVDGQGQTAHVAATLQGSPVDMGPAIYEFDDVFTGEVEGLLSEGEEEAEADSSCAHSSST
jgi:hypothetical protein